MAEDSGEGVIDGQLILKTGSGSGLADLDVILIFYTDEMDKETQTTKTDAQGKFEFIDLGIDKEYMLSVYYEGIDYYYPVVLSDGNTRVSIELSVFGTTASDVKIKSALNHIIIYVEEESVSVTEVFLLINDGDRTYVGAEEIAAGEKQASLVFTLPEGATDFYASSELMQDFILLDNNEVADTLPFPPGERQLVYSYKVAKEISSDFTLNLIIDYPTDMIEVMVQDADIEVASTLLRPEGPTDSSTGEKFLRFSGENLIRGDTVDISISSLSGSNGAIPTIVWFIAGVVILGISIYMVKRKRTHIIISGVGNNGDDVEVQE